MEKEIAIPEGENNDDEGKKKEESEIECRRGGNNQPKMTNDGVKGNRERQTIATLRAKQLAYDESCRRVGGNKKEELETAAMMTATEIVTAKEI